MWRVFLLDPYPILGIVFVPLNLRRTRQSIPFGLRHEASRRLKRSDWKRGKRFVRFLTIFLLIAGVGAIFVVVVVVVAPGVAGEVLRLPEVLVVVAVGLALVVLLVVVVVDAVLQRTC